MPAHLVTGEHPVLRVAVATICAYELAALTTGRCCTISHRMWQLAPSRRALVWTVVTLVLTDHFFTRRFT